jgi:hypothetical protein
MRVHITLREDTVRELDRRVGPRRRSAFIAGAVRRALDDERRWELIESSLGSIDDEDHPWDGNPAVWVHTERHADERRTG